MSHQHRFIRAVIGAAATAAGMGFGPAHADEPGQDWKGYAGVNCLSSNDSANVRRSAVNQIGFANHGTSTITVFCPVVRDVSEASDLRVTRIRVHFRNRNSKVDGRCEFSSRDSLGMNVDSKSVAAPFGEHTLTIEGPIKAETWGSYVLSCQLPGVDAETGLPSYIVNYRIDEKL
jgi:hypothetical protein